MMEDGRPSGEKNTWVKVRCQLLISLTYYTFFSEVLTIFLGDISLMLFSMFVLSVTACPLCGEYSTRKIKCLNHLGLNVMIVICFLEIYILLFSHLKQVRKVLF